MEYEVENDIPTIEDKNTYYYGFMGDYEREELDEINSPARSVMHLINYIDVDDRSMECDIAEMRRLVAKFLKTEE